MFILLFKYNVHITFLLLLKNPRWFNISDVGWKSNVAVPLVYL